MHGTSSDNPTPEKRALYLKMASLWHQMAQRWEKKGEPASAISGEASQQR